jgi:hypothetical protein
MMQAAIAADLNVILQSGYDNHKETESVGQYHSLAVGKEILDCSLAEQRGSTLITHILLVMSIDATNWLKNGQCHSPAVCHGKRCARLPDKK